MKFRCPAFLGKPEVLAVAGPHFSRASVFSPLQISSPFYIPCLPHHHLLTFWTQGRVRKCPQVTRAFLGFLGPGQQFITISRELTPLEEASLQNQKLKAAYEARMARLDPSQATQKTSLVSSAQGGSGLVGERK